MVIGILPVKREREEGGKGKQRRLHGGETNCWNIKKT